MVDTRDLKSLASNSVPVRVREGAPNNTPLAQRLEQSAHNALVTGSNPVGSTIFRKDNYEIIRI